MYHIRRKIYKIRIELLYISNYLLSLFVSKDKKIYIISSLKYKNKVKEDLCLQRCFLKNGYFCKIVAWEDNDVVSLNLIRSVWGYQYNVGNFINFISSTNVVNTSNKIVNNINKKNQYELLKNNDVSVIDTKFLDDISLLKYKNNRLVIKPIISAGGYNTYIINNKSDIEKYKNLKNIMVQPYIEGIKNGELSVVVIAGVIKYGILRYPGVFTKYVNEKYVSKDNLSSNVLSIVNRICCIDEYSDVSFMRIDLVDDNGTYRVLEVEIVDPQLFVESIPMKRIRKIIYQDIVNSIIK